MADDPAKKQPQDANRVNLSEDYEVRYWTEALGVFPEKLKQLVGEHGNSAAKIRDALAQ